MNEFMKEAIRLYKIGQGVMVEGPEAVCNKIEQTDADHSNFGRLTFLGDFGPDNKPTRLKYLPNDSIVESHTVMTYANWVIDPIGNCLCDIDVYTALMCKWNNGAVLIDRTRSYLGSFLASKYISQGDDFKEYIRIVDKEV